MTRGRFYATAMPLYGILYVIGLMTIHGHHFAAIGAMGFAVVAIIGTAIRPGNCEGRERDRFRKRAAD